MTDDKIKEIYGAIHDLESMEERKSYGELKDMLNTHFYQKISTEATPTAVATKVEAPEVEDNIDLTPTSDAVVDESQAGPTDDDNNQKLDELLKDL